MYLEFLLRWLEQGSATSAARPLLTDADGPAVTAMLSAAFRSHALDVGGPPIAFDAAADFAGKACWLSSRAAHARTREDQF